MNYRLSKRLKEDTDDWCIEEGYVQISVDLKGTIEFIDESENKTKMMPWK